MAKKKKRRNKKKNSAPVIKSRAEMSEAEFNDFMKTSAEMFQAYLGTMVSDSMTESEREMLSRAVSEEYRSRMSTDEVFFNKVNRFVHGKDRNDAAKRSRFFFELMQDICSKRDIKRMIAVDNPGEFRHPDDRNEPDEGVIRPLFSRLRGRYK